MVITEKAAAFRWFMDGKILKKGLFKLGENTGK